MTEEPYWVRDHREHLEREAAGRAYLHPPPPKVEKTDNVVPLLEWDRRIRWWPLHKWERYETISRGDDMSPSDREHKLWDIRDLAVLGEDEEGFPVTSVEVWFSPETCEECPQDCGYVIIHKADTADEQVVCEGNFDSIEEAREEAVKALAALLYPR
jgi:hypothetical protein